MQDDRGAFDEQAILTKDFQPHTQHKAAGRNSRPPHISPTVAQWDQMAKWLMQLSWAKAAPIVSSHKADLVTRILPVFSSPPSFAYHTVGYCMTCS